MGLAPETLKYLSATKRQSCAVAVSCRAERFVKAGMPPLNRGWIIRALNSLLMMS